MAARWADCLLVPGLPLDQATEVANAARQRTAVHGRQLRLGIHFYVTARMTKQQALAAACDQVGHIDDAVRHRLGGLPGAPKQEPGSVYWMGMRQLWRKASVALVGSYDDVARTLTEYARSGFTTFVISAYPACAEAKRFGAEIIPRLAG
jgi:alkanesulfonate monooxygenase